MELYINVLIKLNEERVKNYLNYLKSMQLGIDQKKKLLFSSIKSLDLPRSNISLTDESGYDSDGSLGSCRSLRKRRGTCVHNLNSIKSTSINDYGNFRSRLCSSPYSLGSNSTSIKTVRKFGFKSYSENELSFHSECVRTSTPYTEFTKIQLKSHNSNSYLYSVPKFNIESPPIRKSNSSSQSSGFLEYVIDLDEYQFNYQPYAGNVLQLIHRYASYLLPIIFSNLEGKDLLNISNVNTEFRNLISHHSELVKRIEAYKKERRQYRQELEKQKENIIIKGIPAADYTHSIPRSPLKEIQKTCVFVKPSIPIVSLFDRFVKEGKKLSSGETQQKCVNCQFPAKVLPNENKAFCSSEKCKYIFCTRCLLKEHRYQSECPTLMSRPKISTMKLISKACKKRLRRL